MSDLRFIFYGDDFTGSTDALEQLTLAGIRAALFIRPPTSAQLKRFPGLQAIGVAGFTRSLPVARIRKMLRPAFKKLRTLGARHIHYKVCSTFDSSPKTGSIGRAIEVGMEVFHPPFVPVLAAAPALGRYTIFGNHFAQFGIGSNGRIHRLDRHPSVSRHPITPMTESDLCQHLARQTNRRMALFDILSVSLPEKECRAALRRVLAGRPEVVLFDALSSEHVKRIGALLDSCATTNRPLFSVGSSGIEMSLAGTGCSDRAMPGVRANRTVGRANQILVGSGSCSPITGSQIAWALKRGFAEVPVDTTALLSHTGSEKEIRRVIQLTVRLLRRRRSVIVHTAIHRGSQRAARRLKGRSAEILGTALGKILRSAQAQYPVRRLCIAGGDTSSYAARAWGIEALEMIAPLTRGAPVCRAFAPNSPVDGCEVVFKGGQVGGENYFEIVKRGKA